MNYEPHVEEWTAAPRAQRSVGDTPGGTNDGEQQRTDLTGMEGMDS